MSREIKFRAWRGNKMVQVDQITMGENTWICNGGIGISIPFQPSIPLMQYTGLKDKNGVDIYEGDIVSFDVMATDRDTTPHYNKKGNVVIKPYAVEFGGWIGLYCHNLTVVGNIHQNPELLKGGSHE